jgi:hypothetical protein
MDSVGQLIQSLSMLDSHPSTMVEPHDASGDCVGSTAGDTERDCNFESVTDSNRYVDINTALKISVHVDSGDEPPEERPVTLKRRYMTVHINPDILGLILSFISHHFIVISLLLYLCDIHQTM